MKGEIVSMALDQIDMRLLPLHMPAAQSVKKMAESLKARGQLTPIMVAQEPPMAVDGFKRIQAAQGLGIHTLKAIVLNIELPMARAMMVLLNRSGSFSMIQEALVVRALINIDGLRQKDAAIMLERHKSWVSRRLLMIQRLAPEIIEDINLGLIPPGSAPTLAQLQPCNQADFSVSIKTHGLDVKEIRNLTRLWSKATDPDVKRYLLQSPRQTLEVLDQETDSTRPDIFQKMWKLLKRLEQSCQGRQDIAPSLQQITSSLMVIHKAIFQEHP